jgi:hypothetical protein
MLLLLLLLSVTEPHGVVEGPPPADTAWSLDAVWDDGQAEVATYEAHRVVYGADRPHETVILTVKEDLDAARGVKADLPLAGRRLVTVLKTNIISAIPTDNYTYHYMTSIFTRRDDPLALVKLAGSSQEWCGTTYQEVITWDGPPRLEHHSYFDGQADGVRPIELGRTTLLEDHLVTAARSWRPAEGVSYAFLLHASLISNQAAVTPPRRVVARLAGHETVRVGDAGIPVRRIEIHREGDPGPEPLLTLRIEEAPRSALVGLDAADGRRLRLSRIVRRNYWSRSAVAPPPPAPRSLRRE